MRAISGYGLSFIDPCVAEIHRRVSLIKRPAVPRASGGAYIMHGYSYLQDQGNWNEECDNCCSCVGAVEEVPIHGS